MERVLQSAEHHFISKLDVLKTDPAGWFCLYFSLSKWLNHSELVQKPEEIARRISEAQKKRDVFLNEVYTKCESLKGYIYAFTDLDVLILSPVENEQQKDNLQAIFKVLSSSLAQDFADLGLLAPQIRSYLNFADHKLLSAQRYKTYSTMSDTNKVHSIKTRRKRRDEPLIMVVEDDRFTAHYATTILNGEYETIICKTAEEAIEAYIEYAPDIVFMDIHLPGLSGLEAVEAIYAIDRDAYIVMLSVDTERDSVVRASHNGARKFLKKPYARGRMLETIKSSPHVRALMRTTSVGHETMTS